MPKRSFLRRYTNLAGVIHILGTRNIALLDPESWDDSNDVFFMQRYKELKKAKSVAALCFAQETETYHHWRVFSPGSDGVCLDLDRERFLRIFARDTDVCHGLVNYEAIDSLRRSKPSVEELPYLKRLPYKHESEFRVVHTALSKSKPYPKYKMPINCINKVVLSPWMPKPLVKSVKELLKSIDGCRTLTVYQTTVIDNPTWKGIAAKAM